MNKIFYCLTIAALATQINSYTFTRLGSVLNTDPAIGHILPIESVTASKDGNTIITGSSDRTLIEWQRGKNGQFHIIQRLGIIQNTDPAIGHIDSIDSVAASKDGNTIVSGSADHTLIVWHRGKDGLFHMAQRLGAVGNKDAAIGHTNSIGSIALSPDDNTIISGSFDRTLIVWHRGKDGQFQFNPQHDRLGAVGNRNADIGHTKAVLAIALSQDGNTMLSGSNDGTIIRWHRGGDGQFRFNPKKDRLAVVRNDPPYANIWQTNAVTSVALSADDNTIISGSADRTIIVWNLGEDVRLRIVKRLGAVHNENASIGHTDSITSVALSPDGKTIISGSKDRTAIIWN